jgi:phosphoglycolate phosphatase
MNLPRSRPLPHRPKAVAFDLDGTLVDSAPDLCGALNRLLKEHGRDPVAVDELRMMVGDGAAALIEKGFNARGGDVRVEAAKLLPRFIEHYYGAIAELSRPFEGVSEALALLQSHGVKLGVCTNKPDQGARQLLDALDLNKYFEVIVGAETPARKPDPRHLMAVLDALNVAPADAVMVGDSINDIDAARAAGVGSVAVTFGYTRIPARELGASAAIDKFNELPALLGYA